MQQMVSAAQLIRAGGWHSFCPSCDVPAPLKDPTRGGRLPGALCVPPRLPLPAERRWWRCRRRRCWSCGSCPPPAARPALALPAPPGSCCRPELGWAWQSATWRLQSRLPRQRERLPRWRRLARNWWQRLLPRQARQLPACLCRHKQVALTRAALPGHLERQAHGSRAAPPLKPPPAPPRRGRGVSAAATPFAGCQVG